MKLRQIPEDFVVEEVLDIPIEKTGKHYIYSLSKTGMESFALFDYLAKVLHVPRQEIGICGLKDKHAVTVQYVSIPMHYGQKDRTESHFSLQCLGRISRPLTLGAHSSNRFCITVRDVMKGELDGVREKAATIGIVGIPNYFDSQRFGSVTSKHFIIKLVLKRNYESAVRIYLTSFTKNEKGSIKKEKEYIEKHWGEFGGLDLGQFRGVQHGFRRSGWLGAYNAIPSHLRELYVSVYQSYLWNECLKVLLQMAGKRLYTIPYAVGKLRFFKVQQTIPSQFPTISDRMMATPQEELVLNKILIKEKATLQDFAIKHETGNFFISHLRDTIVYPKDFSISAPLDDELNYHRFKFVITFTLPKGSYATIVTKRLFNH